MLARLLNGECGRERTIAVRFHKTYGSISPVTDDPSFRSGMPVWEAIRKADPDWEEQVKKKCHYNPEKDGAFGDFLLDCVVSFRYKPHWNNSHSDKFSDINAWRWK